MKLVLCPLVALPASIMAAPKPSPVPPPAQTSCGNIVVQSPKVSSGYEGYEYSQFFSGTGYTTNPKNDSGRKTPHDGTPYTKYPVLVTNYTHNVNDTCGLLSHCVHKAYNDSGSYMSVDFHYELKQKAWICIQYPGYSDRKDYYKDSSIGPAYGYSFTFY